MWFTMDKNLVRATMGKELLTRNHALRCDTGYTRRFGRSF